MSAFAGQIANLRNGFSIHFDRKEQSANSTRLFTSTGYLDIASDQIASFEAGRNAGDSRAACRRVGNAVAQRGFREPASS